MARCRILLQMILRALLLVLCLLWSPTLRAETERVLDFASTVFVDPDGSLLVSEVITVQATGDQIKRGIVREFPTRYSGPDGVTMRVGFALYGVERDGQPESYHTEDRANGVAVYIGQKDVFLRPGRYSFTITYKTTRQLGFFADHDELYWNVNGNGWRLPMDRVSCVVHLPGGAKPLQVAAYEGPHGSTDRREFSAGGNPVSISSGRAYAPGEGLTVAVSWPKGFVAEPTAQERILQKAADRGALAPAVAGGAILLLYYLLAWRKVGRDPAKGVIIPRFDPPRKFSPAAIRMLWQMKFDDTAFSSSLVNMAVKGGLRIKDNGETRLELAESPPATLSSGEKAAWEVLRKAGKTIVLDSPNHLVLRAARAAIKDQVHSELSSTYFKKNSGWVAPGVVITLGTILGMAWFAPVPPVLVFISVWLTGWTFGCFTLVRQAWRAWKMRGVKGKIGAVILSVFCLPFLGGEMMGLGFFLTQAGPVATALFLGMIVCNALFYELLKAPTVIGRQVLDEIEGFRLYLSVAEEDRLNLLHPPDETPALFEKFLPYALALGVENEWGERFAGILGRAGYTPQWYQGAHWNHMHPGSFATDLGGSFSSTVSSSSASPGSSSGMGGGSSGGGGGGGGGGGW